MAVTNEQSRVDSPANAVDEKQMQRQPSPGSVESGELKKPPYTAFAPARRRYIVALVATIGFLGPLAGNIYLPALPVLQQVFGVNQTALNATVSAFMIVFAFAPLFWTTFSDYKGRRPLYLISIAIYILANVLIAAVPANFGALVFLRVLQAFGSAAVISMGAGTVADVTEPKKRASAMGTFLLGPQVAPVLGPVIGGALAGDTSWRWIFGFLAIFSFTLWLVMLFTLPETLRARVGNGQTQAEHGWLLLPPKIAATPVPEEQRGPAPPKPTLKMYFKMFTYPPIGIVSMNTAILYSTYFAMAVELPNILETRYYWSSSAVGAGYLAVGLAMIAGSLIGGRANDWRRAHFVKKSEDGKVDPESRLTDQIWGVICCAAGTIMFGIFTDHLVHPAAVIVATFLTGFGMSWVFVATTAFLTECVPQQAAGCVALGNMLRSIGATVVPVITPALIRRETLTWYFTSFGILDLVVVGSAVLVLNIKGPQWRAKREARLAAAKAAK